MLLIRPLVRIRSLNFSFLVIQDTNLDGFSKKRNHQCYVFEIPAKTKGISGNTTADLIHTLLWLGLLWLPQWEDVCERLPDGCDPLVLVVLGARPHGVRVQVLHVHQVEGERPSALRRWWHFNNIAFGPEALIHFENCLKNERVLLQKLRHSPAGYHHHHDLLPG